MENELTTRRLVVDDTDSFISLFGINDENIELIKKELDINIFAHGGEVTLSGSEQAVETGYQTLQKLMEIIARGDSIDKTRIRYAIDLASEGNADRIGEIMRDVIAITWKGRQVKCKTLGQKKYVDAIKKNTCVFGIGPAGTGKTYLAVAMAVVALKNKDVERIVLTRPAVEAGEKLGFLPGDLQQKVDPYLRPLYDAINEMMGAEAFQRLIEKQAVEVAPLAYMRGRTLNDAFIILDEAQNTTSEQMKMFLTRLGNGSKMVVHGDITQIDLPDGKKSGLIEATRILTGINGIEIIRFSQRDIVRNRLVTEIVKAYEKRSDQKQTKGKRKGQT